MRVQPGVVQDELNHYVRPMGLLFGPDTSTSNRATLGGMLGNNSGGSHSIAYGLTVDHVLEITVLLSDGSRAVFGEVTPAEFAAKCRLPDLEGEIYREVARIRDSYADEIRARYPAQWRRVAGYNLNELLGVSVRPHSLAGGGNAAPRPFSMARLITGSEGMLAVAMENPLDFQLISRLCVSCNQRIAPVLATREDIDHALSSQLDPRSVAGPGAAATLQRPTVN